MRHICELVEDEMISEWEGLLDKLQIFEKMYQTMRLVDPVAKKVLTISCTKLKRKGGIK